jgi:cytochrome P450
MSSVPFYEALHVVEDSIILQVLLPLWFMEYSPIASLRRIGKAQRCLLSQLKEMLQKRRGELVGTESNRTPPRDILGSLAATQVYQKDAGASSSGTELTEEEIIGNIFIFVIAGHKTTAHTLTFALALLALHPKWQDKLYEEIVSSTDKDLPSYSSMNSLPLALATCYETMRLKDLVMTLPKVASEDVTLPYSKWAPDGTVSENVHLIPKGSHVVIDSPAGHRNPHYWPSPTDFDPTRHLADATLYSPNFTGFSKGERKCIGKRFAEVEMVSFLSHFIKTFTWTPVTLEGETREQVEQRLLASTEGLGLRPGCFDLDLKLRNAT